LEKVEDVLALREKKTFSQQMCFHAYKIFKVSKVFDSKFMTEIGDQLGDSQWI
jgi:hypothetical protein